MTQAAGNWSLRPTPSGWAARVMRDGAMPHAWQRTFSERHEAERWIVNAIGEVIFTARRDDDDGAAA